MRTKAACFAVLGHDGAVSDREDPWEKVELGFRKVRHVRRALFLLALLVIVVAVLVEFT